MPDISTACNRAVFLVVIGNFYAVEYSLCCNDLIRTHNEQQIFACENAVFRQDIEYCMLCEKGLCEVHNVRNDLVIRISPKRSKLKAVACFGLFTGFSCFFYRIETCGVTVIFRIRAVGDYKYLHILKQPTACPEAVTLIAVYLIECFADWYTAPFQLDMHQRKAVHKHGNIIAILTFSCVHLILIYDLKAVVMDILLINECDILR